MPSRFVVCDRDGSGGGTGCPTGLRWLATPRIPGRIASPLSPWGKTRPMGTGIAVLKQAAGEPDLMAAQNG